MISRISVRSYLALSYGLFLLVVLGGTSIYWIYNQENVAEESLLVQLKERARLLSTVLDVQDLSVSVNSFPTIYTATNQNLQVVYLSQQGEFRNLSDIATDQAQRSIIQDLGAKALRGGTVTWEDEAGNSERETLYAASPVYDNAGRVVGAVCLLLPLDDFHKSVVRARSEVLGLTVVLALLAVLLGYLLASPLVRPLVRAQRLARRVAEGDYSQRLPEAGLSEIAQLTADLNQMTDDLADQNSLRKLVLANVTHELARPLGGLRLAVDSLRHGAMEDKTTARELLTDMRDTLRVMASLIEDVALAAKPGNKAVELHKKRALI